MSRHYQLRFWEKMQDGSYKRREVDFTAKDDDKARERATKLLAGKDAKDVTLVEIIH